MADEWKTVTTGAGKEEFVTSAATVSIIEGKVKICYLDKFDKVTGEKKKDVNFSDGVKCKVYEMNELPMAFSAEDEGAEVILRVKSSGSKIIEFLPNNEVVHGRFIEMWRSGGKETNPIPVEAKKWKDTDADVLQFVPIFKIEGGTFDGKTVCAYMQFSKSGKAKVSGNPYTMNTFPKDEEGFVGKGFKVLPNFTTGYKWSDKVYDLRHCGLFDGDRIKMPEDNNPLLLIEQKLLRANKLVELEIEGGYVVSINAIKKMTMQPKPVDVKVEQGITANPDEM